MAHPLFIGFRGKNNSSGLLACSLSPQSCLLTNSFEGLQRDIDQLPAGSGPVYLFGADKNLHDSFRIEQYALKGGILLASALDPEGLARRFVLCGIKASLSASPSAYLCNAAYGRLIEKYGGKAVLIHIPTMRHFDREWIPALRQVFAPGTDK